MTGLIKKVDLQLKNQNMSFSEAISFSFKFPPRFIGAMILWVMVISGSFIGLILLTILGAITNATQLICLSTFLLVIVGILIIYIYLRLALFMQSCVIEDIGNIDCLKRRGIITKGNATLIFVTALILGIIGMIFSIPFMIACKLGIPCIASIGPIVSFIIMGPITAITFTLLYFKLIRTIPPPQNHPPIYNQYMQNQPPNFFNKISF